jgi:hypothetical protein
MGTNRSNELAIVARHERGVDEAGDGDTPGRGVVAGEHLGGDDGVGGLGEVHAVPADEARADVAELHLGRHARLEVVVVVGRAAVAAARHEGPGDAVRGVVGHQVVLGGVHVDEDERGVHHPAPELGAGAREQRVEAPRGGVVGLEAAVGVEVGVAVPRDGQLLRQAAQRAGAVDPELAGAVRVQRLSVGVRQQGVRSTFWLVQESSSSPDTRVQTETVASSTEIVVENWICLPRWCT